MNERQNVSVEQRSSLYVLCSMVYGLCSLCRIPFLEAKRGLQLQFVHCRLHIDVE